MVKEAEMFCDKCGAQVPDDSAFCPVCGNRVVAQQGAVTGNTGYVNMGAAAQGGAGPVYGYQGGTYPGAAPAKKKKSSLPIILGIVAVVAAAAVAGVLFLGKPYMKPIDKFCKAYNDSSIEVMHDAVADVYYNDANFESIIDVRSLIRTGHAIEPQKVEPLVCHQCRRSPRRGWRAGRGRSPRWPRWPSSRSRR